MGRTFRGAAMRAALLRCGLATALSLAFAAPHGAALAADGAGAGAADGPPPVESFFRSADIDEVVLSPSGRWAAITSSRDGGRRALVVIDLKGETPSAAVANFSDADVDDVRWLNEERLLFSTIDLQRGSGDQRHGPGLLAVKRDGSVLTTLIGGGGETFQTGTQLHGHDPLTADHALLFVPRDGGDDIVVGQWSFDQQGNLQAIAPKRMDVVTRHVVPLLTDAPAHVKEWLFDPHGEPRVAIASDGGHATTWWRAPGAPAWKPLATYATLDAPWDPIYVDAAGVLYVTEPSGAGGADVIKRFDFAKGAPEAQPIVSTPGFDADGPLRLDEHGARAIGVHVDTDAGATLWFDPAMQALQALVDARLPGRVNTIACHQCATGGALLVLSQSDQEPGEWLVFWPADKKWQAIGRARRDIVARQMAQLDFHRTTTRDGEDLPVWVTTPRQAKGAPPPPAVVLVHGGPFVRGTHWSWNAEAQFLASRGYAVIEPEFRGSVGYGAAHERAGWKQWGGKMQDDVADAVTWAATHKLVDPKRVCIAGASYGGYAALMGPIRYPALYRCAIAWVAVTDPRLLYVDDWTSDLQDDTRLVDLPSKLGDLHKDAALLADASAVDHAAALKVPVLLAFGGSDRRVPFKHGTEMRDALHAAGNDPEWLVYPDEGHGWLQLRTNVDFWTHVEAFLAKNDR